MLSAADVAFAYRDAEPVLSAVTFAAQAGDVLAIVGRNGAGKSTLLRLLNGLLRPRAGTVIVDGCDTATTPVHLLAQHIGTVFQAPEQQIFNATVREEIAFGPRRLGLHGAQLDARVGAALELAGLSDRAAQHPLDLDQAALRFVALASVLAMRPPVLLLDEPQRGLGAAALARLDAIVAQQAAAGTCVLMVCHDMDFVAHRASRVLAIAGGRVVADAPVLEFFGDPAFAQAAGVESPDTIALAAALGRAPALDPVAFAAAWLGARAGE